LKEIARAPARPPATSPSDDRYWDERDLEAELRRTFQVCHECRMCVNYCGSFPELFARVDRDIEAGKALGAEALDDGDMREVVDRCWQCKVCYIKCPYTPDEGASELLDFPRLMLREKVVRARREGVSLLDRALGEPQRIGALGSGIAAPLGNFVQTSRLLRKVQEKAVGISADFPLPAFKQQTFRSWLKRHREPPRAGEAGEVVLFTTCYGEYHVPEVPIAAVRVLEHASFRVRVVDETCCGMPNLDGGDLAGFRQKVRANVAALLPLVRAGARVLVTQATCGYTLKREWIENADEPGAREIAAATFDLMEFLELERKEKRLPTEFDEGLGTVAYHAPCHLRAQKIGSPGARLLGRIPDTEVRVVEQCSAVDGTWGMKARWYEMGRRYAQKLVRAVAEGEPDLCVSDCGLSALRIQRETGRRTIHPVEALARAYGLDRAAPGDHDSDKGSA
jgi:glycerol-3-phosphate dehydrogenase subunit C